MRKKHNLGKYSLDLPSDLGYRPFQYEEQASWRTSCCQSRPAGRPAARGAGELLRERTAWPQPEGAGQLARWLPQEGTGCSAGPWLARCAPAAAAEGAGGTAPALPFPGRAHRAAALLQNSLLLTSEKPLPFPTPHSGHTCPYPSPARSAARRARGGPRAQPLQQAMSEEDYLCVESEEEEDESLIVDAGDSRLSTQSCMPAQQNSEANSVVHHTSQLAYGSEGLPVLADLTASQMGHSAMMQRGDGHSPEKRDFVVLRNKRKRISPAIVEHSVVRTREEEYEDSDSVIYEYEPDYECESILSEASYTGYQQNPLMEVLSYCQAMYDRIQKLDKKFDLLHRKVSEMQHTHIKPFLLKPKRVGFTYRSSSHLPSGKIRVQKHMERDLSFHRSSSGQGRHSPAVRIALQNSHVQVNSKIKHVLQSFPLESHQPVGRQSPPLPTIVSTHSLHSSYTATNGMPDLSPQSNLAPSIVESTVNIASSPVPSPSIPAPSEPSQENNAVELNCRNASEDVNISEELPSSSVFINPSFGFVGDPARNVKVLGNHLVKAQQKTKPKYAACHLVRVLFPKKTLLCSTMGASARGRRTLDPNKIAAIREFLATNFPTYDLSECGKDWKACITNVNSMIRSLRSETKAKKTTQGKKEVSDAPDTSHCVDLNDNEDSGDNSQNSQKMTSSTTDTLQNSELDEFPEAFHTSSVRQQQSLEPMEPLGSPWRNVQLPFSIIYVAKGKVRPELSARFLIRHMFPEELLVKSNVYGSLDRGMSPLDSNKINALREFLQENFPSFDLDESGFDWKACVAAINSTIRSLRHELKKATSGTRQKARAVRPSSAESPRGSHFRKAVSQTEAL
ncbi:BEN domain-containing protein 2 [Onychostruthus taczanowskii]|uniref:BEN domain-containing protein 2 n=1 Tax=Onychostruthus taczanowskii TaxID=356909 RepID=UPI001B805F59|nr:BEN domain-containing protein 2 [Onychostruthus taczanowskii]